MTSALLTPYGAGSAIELGNSRWRKRLLPVGTLDYKGQKLEFTPAYLKELVRAFNDKAFDQVPFQLADAKNTHTNDPERYRGQIVGVEFVESSPDGPGLDLILEPTEDGERILRQNPGLGVSARIYEDYARSDGKSWFAALQHVLGTLDPHIPGMGPWKEVAATSLSNQPESVLDLTGSTFEQQGKEGKRVDKKALAELLRKVRDGGSDLSDEDIDELVAETDPNGETPDETELTDQELDELIAAAEAENFEAEDGDDSVLAEEDAVIAASNRRTRALELSNQRQRVQLAAQADELNRLTAGADASAFEAEKLQLANDYGIPPAIIDAARPLLEGSGHVIELSGGDVIDAGAVMRNVLTTFGKQIKVLDLGNLIGSGLEPDDEKEAAERQASDVQDFVKSARTQFAL